jgi:dephospho-CoA kinase
VPLIAVTGGIAAGKSTVCAQFRELGAHVESADDLVRFVQRAGSPVLEQIRSRFGFGVIGSDGELDRAALGRLIFEDADARRDLESIVHPAIGLEFQRRISSIYAEDALAIIIYDIPLLVETRRASEFDEVVVLSCPESIRRERLMESRGLLPEDANARIGAQANESERLAVADFVIDTSGTIEHTQSQVVDVWSQLVAAYRA